MKRSFNSGLVKLIGSWLFVLFFGLPIQGRAAEHVIEMLTSHNGEMMVFSKPLVFVSVGETVRWQATDKSHSVRFVDGGTPPDIEPLKSSFNEDAQYTFTKPGIYLYKCPAHYGMGMVGLVVVGSDLTNLERINSLSLMPAASKRVASLTAMLSASSVNQTPKDPGSSH